MSTLEESIVDELLPDVEEEEEVDPETPETPETTETQEDEDGDIEITIGEPEPLTAAQIADLSEEKLPKIKEFRKALRDTSRKNKELEARIKELEAPIEHAGSQSFRKEEIIPTLEACGYDEDMFREQLLAYSDIQHNKKAAALKQEIENEKNQQEWAVRYEKYKDERSKLKVQDYEDVEQDVIDKLTIPQQELILRYGKKPAEIVYALGKTPAKLDELSAIRDPIEFALKLKEVELQINVKKVQTKPESTVITSSSAGTSGAGNAHLEKLREKAQETGDYTAVVAYKRQLAAKGK